ncbi:hypothetical protein F4604DRAFT_1920416 [Suillus subluteus]|nr:hypothetical protein F4604DRAFT_1920416 [Suillus subluteus]
MPTALTKFTPYSRPDAAISALDARAIGYQAPLVITTPNMDWVPELHNDDIEELMAQADGCFGAADCFQWPQMYCKEFEYAVCIPRKDTSSIDLQFAWFTPTTADFAIQPGTAFAVGTLHSHIVDSKKDIITNMLASLKHDINVLRRHPLTYRDIIIFVAQVQRSFLDIIAFMDYVEIVQPHLTSGWSSWGPLEGNSRWMGCFTTDSKICDIYLNAGVPMWLVRTEVYISPQMNIIKPVVLTFPDDLTKNVYCEGNITRPFPLLYRGYTGTFAVNPGAPLPSTLPQNQASGKAPSQGQKNKKARKITSSQLMKPKDSKIADAQPNRDKWEDLCRPENPEAIGFWTSAFQKANKDKNRVKKGLVDQGYRFPEPALLITPSSPERKKLFVANWLAARPLWISRVDHNPPERFPSPQLWRDFLNSSPSGEPSTIASSSSAGPTAAAMRKQAATQIFGEDLQDTQGTTWAIGENVQWRNMTISIISLCNPPLRLMRLILWELYKLNFRYELLALDRVMARASWEESQHNRRDLLYSIFPEEGGFVMWSSSLPDDDSGLWGRRIIDAFPCVDNFCKLLSCWEDSPPHLNAPLDASAFDATTYFQVMQQACDFTCNVSSTTLAGPPSSRTAFLRNISASFIPRSELR